MALTFTQLTPAAEFWQVGNLKECIIDITGDSSYATGGYSIPSTQWLIFGMLAVYGMDMIGANAAGALYQIAWDNVNKKLLFLTAGAEVGNGNNISTIKVRVRVTGK